MPSRFRSSRAGLPPALRRWLRVAVLMLLGAGAGNALAACGEAGTPCAVDGAPASQPANGPVDVGVGNPINVVTGNKYQREVDLPALPGVLGLEIVRHYNSALSAPSFLPGPIGRGWRLSYETTLSASGNTITITQADGSILVFGRDLVDQALARHVDPAHGTIAIRRGQRGDEYLWTWRDGRKLSFDARGHLLQIQAAGGEILALQYDARGLLVSVTDPQGRSLRLAWLDGKSARAGDRFRGVQSIDSPVGRFDYRYGSTLPKGAMPDKIALLANLNAVAYPDGTGRQYHYEDGLHPTLLTGISIAGAAHGKTVSTRYATYAYRGDGKAVLSTHAGDVDKITLDFTVPNQTTLTNSLGARTVYRHALVDGDYRLLEERGAGCATCGETDVRYAYDKAGRLRETTRLDAGGRALHGARIERDGDGRVLAVADFAYVDGKAQAPRRRQRFEYGAGGAPVLFAVPSVVAGREHLIRVSYNGAGQPLDVVERGWAPAAVAGGAPTALVRTIRYAYRRINGRSLLASIDGPLPNGAAATPADADITLLRWDAQGSRVEAITAPGNFTSTLAYDAAGRVARVENDEGRSSSFTYNVRGQRVGTSSAGITRMTAYDAFDNPVESGYNKDGVYNAAMRAGFDDAGRQLWTATPQGIIKQQRYDTEGRVIATSEAAPHFYRHGSYQYDERGRLTAATDPNGALRRIVWNAQGLPSAMIDTLGRATRYRYDGAGALAAIDGTRIAMDADSGGAIEAPNGAATRFVKDDFGRTIAIAGADSGLETRSYDAADRIVASADASGNHASYAYDAAGRVVRQVVSGPLEATPQVTRWTYQGRRLVQLDDPNQSERYRYDGAQRLTSKSVTLRLDSGATVVSVTHYAYDALGQPASVSLPDGSVLRYRRDNRNQVVALERSRIRTPWLGWLLPAQQVVHGIERDMVGIRRFTYANGIEAFYQRSEQGTLARLVYRRVAAPAAPRVAMQALDLFVGIGEARAAGAELMRDPHALFDQRYLWDTQGNLLASHGQDSRSNYAYDGDDRLVAAVTIAQADGRGAGVERYVYDDAGNRLLGQQHAGGQADVDGATVRSSFAPGSNRWLGDAHARQQQTIASYDANGAPTQIGERRYVWNALGRLSEVREGGRLLGRYRYNARGERIAKRAGAASTYYLYEDGKLRAELDAGGRVRRQYLYLDDQPVALIDGDGEAASEAASAFGQALADLATAVAAWFAPPEALAYVHDNHLGAPEAVSDSAGRPVWRAAYTAFGALRAPIGGQPASSVLLNLRLPGQYADQETGLYYNHHRYYDPRRGRYLSADPLGLRAGINPYAYVSSNPLKYVDPQGLMLFAFDGTSNSEHPTGGDTISNVLKFYQAYDEIANGGKFYITGIGTTNQDMPVRGSIITGEGFDARLKLGFDFLDKFVSSDAGTDPIDIDVVGFSRGAAEARVWINQLVAKLTDGKYKSGEKSRCINLRFEGVWDTVPHLGALNGDEKKYDFSIPAAMKYAVHAVALNEHRGGAINFHVRSIMDTPGTLNSATRVEKGFIGSHSDIGGSYPEGDLSNVALMWMINQANSQTITFKTAVIQTNAWDTVSNPILHDKSNNRYELGEVGQTRDIVYGNGASPTRVTLTAATVDGKTTASTRPLVDYFPNPFPCNNYEIGFVDMKKYAEWLNGYGVTLKLGPRAALQCQNFGAP